MYAIFEGFAPLHKKNIHGNTMLKGAINIKGSKNKRPIMGASLNQKLVLIERQIWRNPFSISILLDT